MGRFTKGSCWGWKGTVPYPSAARALDVTLEDDAPELVTIVLEPIRNAEDGSAQVDETEIDALVEWGSGQGSSHRAWIDVSRGVTFAIRASRVIVTVRNIGAGQGSPPPARLRASASLGGGCASEPVLRSVRVGQVAAGGDSSTFVVPPFSRSIAIARTPDVALSVRWLSGTGAEIARADGLSARDGRTLVPPGADRFVIANPGTVSTMDTRAVFELAL